MMPWLFAAMIAPCAAKLPIKKTNPNVCAIDHIVFDLCAITDETLNFARSIERAVLEKVKSIESIQGEYRPHDWWKVEVSLYDGELLTIESGSLYGKSDLTGRDEETIRTAGHHLLSFVGGNQSDHIVSANKMVADDHIPDAGNMARVDRDQIKEILRSFNEFRQRGHGMTPDDIIDKWLETEGRNPFNQASTGASNEIS